MNYPDKLIRGISNPEHIDENGYLSAAIFTFQTRPESPSPRLEESINWYDDDGAITQTFNQKHPKNPQEFQFKVGMAIFERTHIDEICNLKPFKDFFSYERDIKENNKYHGNLVLDAKIPKICKTMLPSNIVARCNDIRKREAFIESQ